MGTINVASFGLLIGAMGQWLFYVVLFPRVAPWVVETLLLLPWLATFTISFCRRSPFGPRPFRYVLVFAMCWYTAAAMLAEALHLLLRPAPPQHYSLALARCLMYLGALSFVVFVRFCIVLRRYETAKRV